MLGNTLILGLLFNQITPVDILEVQWPLSVIQDCRGNSIFPHAAQPLADRNIAARIALHVRAVVMTAANYALTGPPTAPVIIRDVRGTAGVHPTEQVPATEMLWLQG